MKMNWVRFSFLLMPLILLLLPGCAKEPYDYSALEKSKPRSILVLPPVNNSVEVNAPYVYLSTISRPLAEKGYYVFPVSVVESFMKENGLASPAEMHAVELDKLSKYFGSDAVLYVTIKDWGQKYEVLSSNTVVRANVRLLDCKTGDLLWDSEVVAQQGSGDAGAGIAGALVMAIVDQVSGTVADRTPFVARLANNAAINDQVRGLPEGPYATRGAVH